MYTKPKVERFGTFRDLTQTGFGSGADGCIVLDPATGQVVDANPNDGSNEPFCQQNPGRGS